ncbi:MAG: ATP-binding cassette domain-containing protein, partial [Vogesella sp.]|uniref:ATP-binding cassette domain-containing protein n=1 Tax=Vogesella sp. TaxID=1904252 RepID=UPI003F2AB54E
MSAIEVVDLSRHYRLGSVDVPALRQVSLHIAANAFTVLSGPSGSGKSTLLNLLGGLDRPDSGHVVVAGQRLDALDDNRLSDFRARHIGFVFQHFNLLPVL